MQQLIKKWISLHESGDGIDVRLEKHTLFVRMWQELTLTLNLCNVKCGIGWCTSWWLDRTKQIWFCRIIWLIHTYLLAYAPRSRWSKGHQRPLTIALCSGLLWSFRTSWSLAVSALLQCLASNCCEAGLSSSSPAGSTSGLGVWCWMLASWGCVRSSPTSSTESAWPLVPVLLAPTDLHFGLNQTSVAYCERRLLNH